MRPEIEIRHWSTCELRAAGDSDAKAPVIEGYGAPFNSVTTIHSFFGSFTESIAPGAFTRSLKEFPDVRALVDHDTARIIGRTKAGSMELREDDSGLFVTVYPPPTQDGKDITENVRNGNIDGMSIGFMPFPGGVKWEESSEGEHRTILEARLFEVSIVTFPAYEETTAAVRSQFQRVKEERDRLLPKKTFVDMGYYRKRLALAERRMR